MFSGERAAGVMTQQTGNCLEYTFERTLWRVSYILKFRLRGRRVVVEKTERE